MRRIIFNRCPEHRRDKAIPLRNCSLERTVKGPPERLRRVQGDGVLRFDALLYPTTLRQAQGDCAAPEPMAPCSTPGMEDRRLTSTIAERLSIRILLIWRTRKRKVDSSQLHRQEESVWRSGHNHGKVARLGKAVSRPLPAMHRPLHRSVTKQLPPAVHGNGRRKGIRRPI